MEYSKKEIVGLEMSQFHFLNIRENNTNFDKKNMANKKIGRTHKSTSY